MFTDINNKTDHISEKYIFYRYFPDFRSDLEQDPDPLFHETDPRIRIRIHIKMKRIRNSASKYLKTFRIRQRAKESHARDCSTIWFEKQKFRQRQDYIELRFIIKGIARFNTKIIILNVSGYQDNKCSGSIKFCTESGSWF